MNAIQQRNAGDSPNVIQIQVEVQTKQDNSHERSTKFHFFHVYFTTCYYICLIPFRPVKKAGAKSCELHTNPFQKTMCYITWVLIMIGQLTSIRQTWHYGFAARHIVIWYFKLAHVHIHACMYLTLYKTLHLKSSEILVMINTISSSNLLKCRGKTWWITLSVYSMWILLGFTSSVVGYGLIDSRLWKFNLLVKSYAALGKYTFFTDNHQPTGFGQEEVPIQNDEIIYACLQFVVTLVYNLQVFTIIPLLGCSSVTIWSATNAFVSETLSAKHPNVEVVSSKFQDLKKISNSINVVWNLFCFWYLVDIVAWYSTELDAGLVSKDWFVKFEILYYLVCYTALMVLSADSFRKMGYVCQWLSGLTSDEESCKNNEALEREMNSTVIGIGSKGFYRFDYSFLSQVTVVIITYFIISVDKSKEIMNTLE